MRRSVTLVTGPAAEPVTLGEAKDYAKIDGTTDDALLAQLITAATQYAEEYLRRAIISQTVRLTLDLNRTGGLDNVLGDGTYDMPVSALYGALPDVIDLPRAPVSAISSVTTYNTSNTSSAFSSDNYYLDSAGGRLVLKQTAQWPSDLRPFAACVIDYVAGYGSTSASVPQPIKTAILMHVQRMYDARIVCDLPPECMTLLNKYRVMGERRG